MMALPPSPIDPNSQQGIMASILGSPNIMRQVDSMLGKPAPQPQTMMNMNAPTPQALQAQIAAQAARQSPVAPAMPGNPAAAGTA
jgi:hypothetical protein